MTPRGAIGAFRETCPCGIGEDTLFSWLSELEGTIREELTRTHEGTEDPRELSMATDADAELTAPSPYSGIYPAYLRMKCDLFYSDTEHYGISSAVFASAWQDFVNWYNRQNMPSQRANSLKV